MQHTKISSKQIINLGEKAKIMCLSESNTGENLCESRLDKYFLVMTLKV